MILGRYILKALLLNLKFSDHVIEADYGTFKGSMAPMVDLDMYDFKYLSTGNITPEESFTNTYTEEMHRLEQVCSYTRRLLVI